jgi:hypothetical protein
MKPHRIQNTIIILLLGLDASLASARPLEFSELSLLVRAHQPDSAIVADASQRKLVRPLTPDQEARLKSQGASDSLLQSLRNSNLFLSASEAATYDASRSAPPRVAANYESRVLSSPRPNVEIVNVAFGHPINLSYWGGPDYDFAFRPHDIVDVGRAEVEMILPAATGVHYATYRGVRVPDWEPVNPEYTSIMAHAYARPLRIDWHNPVRLDDVPYILYPIYAAGGVALYYIGESSCDSVTIAVVTRG